MNSFENDRESLEEEFDGVLGTVEPKELRSYVGRELSTASLTPALLCLLSARATGSDVGAHEAAGIQFVHAGLDATRRVIDEGDWSEAGVEPVEEDMVLLAADVLVTVGFDNLLDHYEAATRVVNTFGEEKALEIEAPSFEERFENASEQFAETYTTAVEIGGDGDPPEELVTLAESLAVVDCLADSAFEAEATEHERRAASIFDGFEAYGAHVEAIRAESAMGAKRAKGVEAQD